MEFFMEILHTPYVTGDLFDDGDNEKRVRARAGRRTYASSDAAKVFDDLRQCIGIDHEVEENVNVGRFGFVQWSKELESSK